MKGATQPALGTLDAVLKFDSVEFPALVYTELVAQRLGSALGVPLADGVLSFLGNAYAYASLMVAPHGLTLTKLSRRCADAVATLYPDEAAALTVFDLLVGNWDRADNVMVALGATPIRMFVAYDHSHALLHVDSDRSASIARLGCGDLIVRYHPFFGRVERERLLLWASRIASLPSYMWQACVNVGTLPGIAADIPNALSTALQRRAHLLTELIHEHSNLVFASSD
ncbi:hypothetical protein [Burkholderia ubonensis]|uniref:hypothetical protein n=1 Tax=Burkholderia ubonensis TaxID=101571 RepID=UPI000AC95066|nr:hypothetical protein [Burkholderia ubonensis]